MKDGEFTRILQWPGCRVCRQEIDDTGKRLRLWVRRKRGNRKRATLDGYIETETPPGERRGLLAARVAMWDPFTKSILSWAPGCRIVYDKFHVMQHANRAVDEVLRAEFFRKDQRRRHVLKGKRWLLLTRWVNLGASRRQMLNELFELNRRGMKAYLLKESLERLWTYTYEGAAAGYLNQWIDQLRWQRLKPMEDLARMLLRHRESLLNYCKVKVRFGAVEPINAHIKPSLRRGRGYRYLGYLLLKAQHMAVNRTEFMFCGMPRKMHGFTDSLAEPEVQMKFAIAVQRDTSNITRENFEKCFK